MKDSVKKNRREKLLQRQEAREQVNSLHEPKIREVTDGLKKISGEIEAIRVRERALRMQRNQLLAERDRDLQERLEQLRGE